MCPMLTDKGTCCMRRVTMLFLKNADKNAGAGLCNVQAEPAQQCISKFLKHSAVSAKSKTE